MTTPASAFTDEERAKIISAIMAHREVSAEAAQRLLRSTEERRAKRSPLLEAQWVRVFASVTKELADGTAQPAGLFVSVFWIRLYGVLTELRETHRTSAELRALVRDGGADHPWLAAADDVFAACTAMHDALSDDELVYAAFARQVHAHVYQTGFELDIERCNPAQGQAPTLRTKQMVRTVRRHIGVDEAHRIVAEVSARFHHDGRVVARAFAKKVETHALNLFAAMSRLGEERERDAARGLDEDVVEVRGDLK